MADASKEQWRRRRILGFVAVAAIAAACTSIPDVDLLSTAPLLMSGRVVAADGSPMGGARLMLAVRDPGPPKATKTGTYVEYAFQATYTAALDGSFEIRLAPTPAMVAAAFNGEFVAFEIAVAAGDYVLAVCGFTRQLDGSAWAGDPVRVELRAAPAAVDLPFFERATC